MNISDKFLEQNKLLLAELFTEKGMRINTPDNLQKVHGDKAPGQLDFQMNLENGYLFSQYAWIKYRKKELEEAGYYIREAMRYKEMSAKPDPVDIIRAGIISYRTGNRETGWSSILEALVEDSGIENKDPAIRSALEEIIKDRTTMQTDVNDYLEVLRYENAETLPDIDLCFQDSITGNMHDFIGRDLIVIFFNPACGSCQQELSAVADLLLRQPGCRNDFIFILNQPEKYEQARSLLDDYQFKDPIMATLKDRNAYDLIMAEPCTWIINEEGKILYKHVGYRQGDETIYLDEIVALRES